MAVVGKLVRFTERTRFLSKCHLAGQNAVLGSFCTMVQQPQRMHGLIKLGLVSAVTGALAGTGYAYYKVHEARKNVALEGTQLETALLKYKPHVTPSRMVSTTLRKKLHASLSVGVSRPFRSRLHPRWIPRA